MGVGYAEDLVVCSALGVDMYDCVFPTRTARFGTALTMRGSLPLRNTKFARDFGKIEEGCECFTCLNHSRSYVNLLFQSKETVGCHLISIHNIAFQMRLMRQIRQAIMDGKFPDWIRSWMFGYFKNRYPGSKPVGQGLEENHENNGEKRRMEEWENGYPMWIVNALGSVNVRLI